MTPADVNEILLVNGLIGILVSNSSVGLTLGPVPIVKSSQELLRNGLGIVEVVVAVAVDHVWIIVLVVTGLDKFL